MKRLIIPLVYLGIGVACGAEWKIRKDVVVCESVVAKTKIRVVVSEQAFDPAKHRIEKQANIGTTDKPKWGPTIDYKPVVGNTTETEGSLPLAGSPQLGKIGSPSDSLTVSRRQDLLEKVSADVHRLELQGFQPTPQAS